MKSKSEFFKYQKGKRVFKVTTIVVIIVAILFIVNPEIIEISKILSTILLLIFLILLVNYTYIFNESVSINLEVLNINKKIGKSIRMRFEEISRITIREQKRLVESSLVMTIFGENKNESIILSDLENQFRFVELIKAKEGEYNFKVVHQDINGQIIKRLKRNRIEQ